MADYTLLAPEDIEAIAQDYGLSVLEFEPLAGGATSSSYRVRARRGEYVLTVFDEKTPAYATRLGRVLLWLADHRFPTARLLRPKGEDLITSHRGKAVMIKDYVVGYVVRDLDEARLYQMGAALARLHQLPVPDFLRGRRPYGLAELPKIVGQKIDPEYEDWAASRIARLEHKIPPGLPRGLIHGDLFYDNILFVGRELQAIIDFGEAMAHYQAYDLGMGIVGSCRRGTRLALDKARALVAGYQQVRRLADREKEVLRLLVELAAIAVSCWRFWKYHIDRPLPVKADKHRRMVRLAEEVRAMPQGQFAQAVFGPGPGGGDLRGQPPKARNS